MLRNVIWKSGCVDVVLSVGVGKLHQTDGLMRTVILQQIDYTTSRLLVPLSAVSFFILVVKVGAATLTSCDKE